MFAPANNKGPGSNCDSIVCFISKRGCRADDFPELFAPAKIVMSDNATDWRVRKDLKPSIDIFFKLIRPIDETTYMLRRYSPPTS